MPFARTMDLVLLVRLGPLGLYDPKKKLGPVHDRKRPRLFLSNWHCVLVFGHFQLLLLVHRLRDTSSRLIPIPVRNFPAKTPQSPHLFAIGLDWIREREREMTTRKKVQKKCKIRGFTLKVDALEEILSFVSRFDDSDPDGAIDVVLEQLQLQPLKSSIIDKQTVQSVVSILLQADTAVGDETLGGGLGVCDAFLVPKFRYDPIKKIFYKPSEIQPPIHGNASAKAALYKDRFLLISQRLSRHQHFAKRAFDSEMSDFGSCEISQIQSLVGQTGRRWVMGLISQLEDGHFYLEDLTASVEINLSNAKITTGFFTENTMVVAEGEMLLEGVFQVITCGFPPLEDRDMSVKLLAGHDFFGGGILTKEETLRLSELEKRAVNDMFVILSDIWLDSEEAMGKLERILDGYENQEVVPSLFVFMGNFSSHPCNLSFRPSSLRLQFGKLGQMIAAHQQLTKRSRFLFIPGPDDPGPSKVLPRCALPKYITEELQKHIPNAMFSSNPCRIYCTECAVRA
ncbi:DNA polymerase epsilon subunit B isoform X5 [Rosa chinensis]|uniref:DNA polymerase epsilon subunit B isoform X5 n=1 Tax=Rosa chinensis TaxID=74649 RepID=UPI001AD90B82|nr:DNA polymerase epsilon subunit B isoform X5 [Rosa chinensis]